MSPRFLGTLLLLVCVLELISVIHAQQVMQIAPLKRTRKDIQVRREGESHILLTTVPVHSHWAVSTKIETHEIALKVRQKNGTEVLVVFCGSFFCLLTPVILV